MTDTNRPPAVDGWLHLRNEDLGGATQRVPETLTDDDLEFYAARGWVPVAAPEGPEVSTPPPAPPAPGVDGAGEWVELVHPLTEHRQQVPNNTPAIEGQLAVGWVYPNKDGSVPKREQRKAARAAGVDVEDLPEPSADASADDMPAETPAPEESGDEPAAGESDQPAGESSANSKGE